MERPEQTALAFEWLLCCKETSVCDRMRRANDLSVFGERILKRQVKVTLPATAAAPGTLQGGSSDTCYYTEFLARAVKSGSSLFSTSSIT